MFPLNQARGRQVGEMASKRSRSKWRQPFTCFMRSEEPTAKTKGTDNPGANKRCLRCVGAS